MPITTEAGKVRLIILTNTRIKTENVKEEKVIIRMPNPTSLQSGFYNLYSYYYTEQRHTGETSKSTNTSVTLHFIGVTAEKP